MCDSALFELSLSRSLFLLTSLELLSLFCCFLLLLLFDACSSRFQLSICCYCCCQCVKMLNLLTASTEFSRLTGNALHPHPRRTALSLSLTRTCTTNRCTKFTANSKVSFFAFTFDWRRRRLLNCVAIRDVFHVVP